MEQNYVTVTLCMRGCKLWSITDGISDLGFRAVCFIGTAKICGSRSKKYYGVSPSICPSMGSQQQTRCCRFAAVVFKSVFFQVCSVFCIGISNYCDIGSVFRFFFASDAAVMLMYSISKQNVELFATQHFGVLIQCDRNYMLTGRHIFSVFWF